MTTPGQHARSRGFTLIELMIALTIFAILSVMAYTGLSSLLDTRAHTDARARELAQLQTAMMLISRDVENAIDRPIRNQYGDFVAAMLGEGEDDGQLELTRAGWRNPAGVTRSSMQRVAYTVEDNQLLRATWRVLDQAQDSEPIKTVVMDEVDTLTLRFMNADRAWQDSWPPQDPDNNTDALLPRAVELTLQTRAWGEITRLFVLSGS